MLTAPQGHPGFIPEVVTNWRFLHRFEGPSVSLQTGTIADATEASIIFITVPTNAHQDVLDEMAQYDWRGKLLVAMPCGLFAGLARRTIPPDRFPELIMGTTSAPYASRRMPGGTINIARLKLNMQIASSGSGALGRLKDYMSNFFPSPLTWYSNLASTYISNVNPVIHPSAMLKSEAAISGPGANPLFFLECIPAAADAILGVDEERWGLASRLGLETDTLLGFFRQWYTPGGSNYLACVEDSVRTTPSYQVRRAPSMNHRFLDEDSEQLVLWREIAVKMNFPTSRFDWVISNAERVLGRTLSDTCVTLASLGLESASVPEIIAFINGV